MEPVVLVRDESHQMNVNVVIGLAARIGCAHSGDAAREISNALRTEVKNRKDRHDLGVKLFQRAEIRQAFPDFGGSGRLRQLLEQREPVWGLAGGDFLTQEKAVKRQPRFAGRGLGNQFGDGPSALLNRPRDRLGQTERGRDFDTPGLR
jgi:hypothetical protein